MFYDFMVDEYIFNVCEDIVVNNWFDGVVYYVNRVKYYIIMDMMFQEIYDLGLFEVKCICV